MTTSHHDVEYMARALRLAAKGLYTTDPNPRVGCVILDNKGAIVGEGWHHRAGEPHAEINALRQAGPRAKGGCAYVSLEPCSHHGRTPPCSDALIQAGVASVVCAMQDPNPLVAGSGIARLREAGISVRVGVLQSEAEALNIGFVRRMQGGLAYTRLKMAQSLDGRSAMASGESQWITGGAARRDVHGLRARSSAIITGIGSALQDDPQMTARLPDTDITQPRRVLLDSQLRLPVQAKLLSSPGLLIYSGEPGDEQKAQALQQAGAEVRRVPCTNGRLDLQVILQDLTQRLHCNEILVEAGATLAGAMLEQSLVDELWLYMAPSLMGSSARPAFQLALQQMQQKRQWQLLDVRHFGNDLRLRLKPLQNDESEQRLASATINE